MRTFLHECRHYSFDRLKEFGMLRPTNTFMTEHGDHTIMSNKEILMGASDYRDLYVSKFIDSRNTAGICTFMDNLCVRGNRKRAIQFIRDHYGDYKIFSAGQNRTIVDMEHSIVEIDVNSNIIDFRIHSTFAKCDTIREHILEHLEEVSVHINWIYDNNMNSITVPIDNGLTPIDEMYPFLNGETLEEFYGRYMDSNASIMILIGPPGTGKTSFIRGYLQSTGSSATVTYDQKILANDSLFSEFIGGSSEVLVIEDADLFLSSRKGGNEMMHKFLNVGDGLVTVKGKKIIFSTNLPSIDDIDEALLRPGRCFDILHFDELDTDAAMRLSAKIGNDYLPDQSKTKHTVADIFSNTRNTKSRSMRRLFGFCPDK